MAAVAKATVRSSARETEPVTPQPSVEPARARSAPRTKLTVVGSTPKIATKNALMQSALEALEYAQTCTFLCDRDFNILHANKKSLETLEAMEMSLRSSGDAFRHFRAADAVSGNLDFLFTQEPMEFRRASDSRNLPYQRTINMGTFVCEVFIGGTYDETGTQLGYAVSWENVTDRLASEKKQGQQIAALEGSNTNVMLTDTDLQVQYVNASLRQNLKKWEPELQKAFGAGFRADALLGRCIDEFHKNPKHQRNILSNESMFPFQTRIKVGNIQIDLTVNCTKDAKGAITGYSTEWLDVTERLAEEADYKAVVKEIADRIEFLRGACSTDLANAMAALANGDFNVKIEPRTPLLEIPSQPDLAVMAETFNGLRNQTVKSVEAYNQAREALSTLVAQARETADTIAAATGDLADAMDSLGNGDLTVSIEPLKPILKSSAKQGEAQSDLAMMTETFNDLRNQTGKSVEAYNRAQESLSTLISQAREAADTIAQGSGEVSIGTDDLSQRTEEQASSLEETASSMEEMTSTVKQNADNAKQANQLAAQAREVAEKGGEVVGRAVSSMQEINQASKKIADIISVIDEIAFQTNLLALNAAVEAARVGEQGRGFAVVAAEVRNLAGRSATAAKEIKSLVQDSVQKVQEGSVLVNQSGQTLADIVNSVKKVADIITEISAASQEQAAGIEQVNKAIMQMDQITQQNAALVEETAAASRSMNQQATGLQSTVGRFKLAQRYIDVMQQRAAAQQSVQAPSHSRTPVDNRRAPRTMATASKPSYRRMSSRPDDSGFEEF